MAKYRKKEHSHKQLFGLKKALSFNDKAFKLPIGIEPITGHYE